MSSKKIDTLIQSLKGKNPLDSIGIVKLWEALKSLSDDLFFTSSQLPKLEVPSGKIDGSNKNFILSKEPLNSFIMVYQNGLLILSSSTILSGKVLKFIIAPSVSDVIQVFYFYRG